MTSFTFTSVVHGFDDFLDHTDVELDCDVFHAVCVTVIGPALPHKWQSAESGREQYARGRTDGSVPVVGCSRFSCAEFVQSRDAALSDDVGLHLEFGRRFFLFTVQRNATNEVSAESARERVRTERVRTVTEVLISSAEEQRLPPCTGPGGGQTATDRLLSRRAWDSRSTYATVEAPQKNKKRPTDRPHFFAGCYPNLTIFSVRPKL